MQSWWFAPTETMPLNVSCQQYIIENAFYREVKGTVQAKWQHKGSFVMEIQTYKYFLCYYYPEHVIHFHSVQNHCIHFVGLQS